MRVLNRAPDISFYMTPNISAALSLWQTSAQNYYLYISLRQHPEFKLSITAHQLFVIFLFDIIGTIENYMQCRNTTKGHAHCIQGNSATNVYCDFATHDCHKARSSQRPIIQQQTTAAYRHQLNTEHAGNWHNTWNLEIFPAPIGI